MSTQSNGLKAGMVRRASSRLLFAGLLIAMFPTSAAAVSITSTFDLDLDGWIVVGNGLPPGGAAHVATGGNPGGYMEITDQEGTKMRAVAPGKFLGDVTSFDGGSIRLDTNLMLDPGGSVPTDSGEIRITDGITTVTNDVIVSMSGGWTQYAASLTAAAWGLSQAQWLVLLSGVTEISINMEAVIGDEVVGLDNFELTTTAIPEPSLLTLWILGGAAIASSELFRRRR